MVKSTDWENKRGNVIIFPHFYASENQRNKTYQQERWKQLQQIPNQYQILEQLTQLDANTMRYPAGDSRITTFCRSVDRGWWKYRQTVPAARRGQRTVSSASAAHGTAQRHACVRPGPAEQWPRTLSRQRRRDDGTFVPTPRAFQPHVLDHGSPSVERRSALPATDTTRVVNIAVLALLPIVLVILLEYRCKYQQYFSYVVSIWVSAIFFTFLLAIFDTKYFCSQVH